MPKLPFPALRYLAGCLLALFCLWVAYNAMIQTRVVVPGETSGEILRAMLFGRPAPGSRPCKEAVHGSYTAAGPDGKQYPTWHPPLDPETGCFFNHEHGSDPHDYVGYPNSGMPLFGYTSGRAGLQEPHQGYKVFVTNDDLNGRAWMITLNQDSSDPGRALAQFHTLDWHISTLAGETLVDLHVLADFGFAIQNCSGGQPIPGSEKEPRYKDSGHPRRILTTTNCAMKFVYERWEGSVQVGAVFKAKPQFDVDNPTTVIDPLDPGAFHPTCAFRPIDEGCEVTGNPWSGNKRAIYRPGQWVQNDGPEVFYTDPTGLPAQEDEPQAVRQIVARQRWDTRQCCGNAVVFRIQSFSGGVYIADPHEPAGLAEFSTGMD